MLVEIHGVQRILASTSLTLELVSIIWLYSYRFRIECTFREMKQQAGAFCYHFWTRHMPELSHYQKNYLRRHFFRLLNQRPELRITKTIQEQQEDKPEICRIYWLLNGANF